MSLLSILQQNYHKIQNGIQEEHETFIHDSQAYFHRTLEDAFPVIKGQLIMESKDIIDREDGTQEPRDSTKVRIQFSHWNIKDKDEFTTLAEKAIADFFKKEGLTTYIISVERAIRESFIFICTFYVDINWSS